ncbi:hypothetical protein [Actinomadura madurae]|nr:hypothetical protein [Actinomadura madurae]
MIRSKTRLLAAPVAALVALPGLAAVEAAAGAPPSGPPSRC